MSVIRQIRRNINAWRRTGTVTIAVAGLSKSGKTAFITSVVANLQAAARNSRAAEWLQGLDLVATGRLRSADRPQNYRPRHGHMLPYKDLLSALTADTPRWPSRTADLYETALDIHFWPDTRPSAKDGGNTPAARLRLVIVDYPGEWLVDVPIISQSYSEWSGTALARLRSAPWSEVSRDFQNLLTATDWTGADNNDVARAAALEWQQVLVAARGRGLKWLQPGQFVRARGQHDEIAVPSLDKERLWFCPLPEAAISEAKSGSLARAMSDRYARYKAEAGQFFGKTLKEATHHLLLVDVLEALAEGERPFHESSEVLAEVYRVFTTETSPFRRLLGKAGLKRVLLLATKADTVPPSQRAALQSLLVEMCSGRFAGAAGVAPPEAEYVAAIRATRDVDAVVDEGEPVRVVEGLCAETGRRRRVTMINVPAQMPSTADFQRRQGVRPPRFVPPKIEGHGDVGVPNVRLGHVLHRLIGEELQ